MAGARVRIFKALLAVVAITTLQATIEILIEIATKTAGIGIDLQMEVATMSAGLGVATEVLVGQGVTAMGGDRRPTPP